MFHIVSFQERLQAKWLIITWGRRQNEVVFDTNKNTSLVVVWVLRWFGKGFRGDGLMSFGPFGILIFLIGNLSREAKDRTGESTAEWKTIQTDPDGSSNHAPPLLFKPKRHRFSPRKPGGRLGSEAALPGKTHRIPLISISFQPFTKV